MRIEDIRTFSELGYVLQEDPSETLAAVSMMELTPDRALERAASALLDRASTHFNYSDSSFFRLLPQERFLLVVLHRGRWSYGRVGRILKLSSLEIEKLAWKTRIALALSLNPPIAYPTGPTASGMNCPEYSPTHPWTQRFLDEEIASGQERIFFQNHLMACDSCRKALNRCRDLYYKIEAALPAEGRDESETEALKKALKAPQTFKSRYAFLRKRDVQLALALGIFLVIWKIFK